MSAIIHGDCSEKGEPMKLRTKVYGRDFITRKGNEVAVAVRFNNSRWYLPFGIDASGILGSDLRDFNLCIGFLCFTVHITKYKGLSPLTASMQAGLQL